MTLAEVSEICKVLSDPHRLQIMKQLVEGEKCASELLAEFTISQPTLSHHMKTMTDSGLLQEKKTGKRTYYSIDRRTWDEFMLVLDTISSKDYWPWDPAQVLKEAAAGTPAPAVSKKDPPSAAPAVKSAASEKPAAKTPRKRTK